MASGTSEGKPTRLVFNPWNLVLLLPFIVLLTPLYNDAEPSLFGMPFFYWFQFMAIAVGVLSTIVVYRMTRHRRRARPDTEPTDVDELDEGSAR